MSINGNFSKPQDIQFKTYQNTPKTFTLTATLQKVATDGIE